MKCPFCAEEINPEAVICRFCYAEKINGVWQSPHEKLAFSPIKKHPSQFTIRTAGAFFLISALFEIIFLASNVTLFGISIDGFVAFLYHIIYTGVFIGMGLGLWQGTPWGFNMMFVGTIIYTLDKIQYLLFDHGLSEYSALLGPESETMVQSIRIIITITIIISWWGFLFFLYRKRNYFKQSPDK